MNFKALNRKSLAGTSAPIELLRIELDPNTNELSVRLAEKPIASVNQIANEALRTQIAGLLQLLTPEKAESQVEQAAVQATAAPEPLLASTQDTALLDDELSAPFFTRLFESLTRQRHYAALTAAKANKAKPAKAVGDKDHSSNLFAQMDAILQRKLREQPDAPPIEIFGDGEQPLIRVGNHVYSQLDAVPDEHARAHIRAAIAEWEAQQFKPMRSFAPA